MERCRIVGLRRPDGDGERKCGAATLIDGQQPMAVRPARTIAPLALSIGPMPINSPAMKTAQPVIGTSTLTGADVESAM